MVRRTIAAVGGLVVLILLVVGVRGCLNARNDQAIEDYSNSAAELLRESTLEGDALFELLQSSGGADATVDIQNTVNGYQVQARERVDRARGLDAPDDVQEAQRYLLEVLELRAQGLARVAEALRVALGDQERREGTKDVTEEMQVFLASDVIYLRRFNPALVEVLREKELAGPELSSRGFVPDIVWLQPDFVADQIEGLRPGAGGTDGEAAPGLHGNGIVSVALGGTPLTPGASASIQLTGDLAFDIQVQNQGNNTETDVTVTVTVGEGGDAIELNEQIDTIAVGESKTVTIPLQEQPPTGQNVSVRAEVEPVPGEEKTDNNSQEFSVIFTR